MNRNSSLNAAVLGGINRNIIHQPIGQSMEALECVNLVPKEGGLRPWLAPVADADLSITAGRELIAIHNTATSLHYITTAGNKLYHEFSIVNGERVDVDDELCSYSGNISIQYIGNVLISIADEKVYILYKDGGYSVLGSKPETSLFSVKGVFETLTFSGVDSISGRGTIGGTGTFVDIPDNTSVSINNETSLIDSTANTVSDSVMVVLNKSIVEAQNGTYALNGKCKFILPVLVRYAIKLYDGNIIYHSAPVFINNAGSNGRFLNVNLFDCTLHSQTVGGSTTWFMNDFRFNVGINSYIIQLTALSDFVDAWKDIISGVEVYVSDQFYTFKSDDKIKSLYITSTADRVGYIDMMHKSKDVYNESIASNSQFYLAKTISPDQIKSGSVIEIAFEENDISTLNVKQVMDDEYLSHHKLTASASFIYNSKLHLCDISRMLYPGYKVKSLNGYDAYNTKSNSINSVVRIQVSTIVKSENVESEVLIDETFQTPFNMIVPAYIYYPDPRATHQYWTITKSDNSEVYIDISLYKHSYLNGAYYLNPTLEPLINGSYNKTGYSEIVTQHTHTERNTNEQIPNMMMVSTVNNPFSFPVETIYRVGHGRIIGLGTPTQAISTGQFGQFPIYVFCSDGIFAGEVGSSAYSSFHPVSRDIATSAKGIISIDNAIVFTTANGLMLLAGNDTQDISGKMEGETVELYRKNSDYGYILNITEVHKFPYLTNYIPTDLKEAIDYTETISNGGVIDETLKNSKRFNTMLQNAEIAYDYMNKQLLIIDSTDRSRVMVYDLASQSFVKVVAPFTRMLNSWPNAMGYDDSGNVYDLNRIINHEERTGTVPVLYVSRPIHSKDVLLKLRELKLNGFIHDAAQLPFFLYGSRRGDDWQLLAGIDISKTNNKVKFVGSGMKYFVFAIAAELPVSAVVTDVEFVSEPFAGNKLR